MHDGRGACDGVTTAHGGHSRRVAMRLLLALAALCAGVSATSQDSERARGVAADAIAHAATGKLPWRGARRARVRDGADRDMGDLERLA